MVLAIKYRRKAHNKLQKENGRTLLVQFPRNSFSQEIYYTQDLGIFSREHFLNQKLVICKIEFLFFQLYIYDLVIFVFITLRNILVTLLPTILSNVVNKELVSKKSQEEFSI